MEEVSKKSRGSSPPRQDAEGIYHDWLKRPRSSRKLAEENESKKSSEKTSDKEPGFQDESSPQA